MPQVREISARGHGRLTATVALICAGLIVAGLVPATSDARQVRAFAVGPKIEIDRWFDTRHNYRNKLFGLFDRRLRGGPDVPPIQVGAGDVASRLLGPGNARRPVRTARDLVALPEDIGLYVALVGPRGEQARATPPAPGSSATAVGSLLTTYAPQLSHYTAQYPGLAARDVPARGLLIALTDTFARVAIETYAELADRHDVYLVAGVNMARDWKVVCNDREAFNQADPARLPGGVRCAEQNPAKVALLRAPEEPGRDYAYEATTPDAVNMGLVFDPAGRLISKQAKAYLTPVELPGVGRLDLKPGRVSGLGAVRTPVGTLGIQTSKDAWMPDVQAKHDLRGVDVLVQPEYFVGDTVRPEGPWSADTLHASGYNNVLRRPGVEAMVLPELTGNAFDLSADAQSHIAVRVRSRGAPRRRALVGQPRQRGFAQVARWVVRDRLGTRETIAERRRRLGLAGERMLPGSGVECDDPTRAGPCENGQVEQVLSADLRVDRHPARRPYRGPVRGTRFTRNRPVRAARHPQRNVALAAHRRLVVAAYEQRRGPRSRVVVTRSRNGGRSFTRRAARPGQGPRQWTPDVAVSGGRVTAAWVEARRGIQRVRIAVSRNGGRSFGRANEVPPAPNGEGPRRQWEPAVAALEDGAYLVYLEEADRSDDDDLPQTRVFGRRVGSDGSLGPPLRLDGGEPVELAAKLDHAWAPSVAAQGGRVTVAWVDFRSYDWRPYARTSEDGGQTFGPQHELSSGRAPDGTPVLELLADSPSVAVDGRGSYVAWSDWRKEEATARRPSRAYDTWIATERGDGVEEEARADDRGGRQLSTFWPAVAARGGNGFVAWQDSAGAIGNIRLARLAGGRRRHRALRVDDTGRAGVNQYRPAVTLSRGRLVAAWEDERNGPAQVYTARAPLASIP
jgi:predicted amidohydrolase